VGDIFLALCLLFLALSIAGLIKPSLIIRWGNRKTRKRVLLFCILPMIAAFVLTSLFLEQEEKSALSNGNKLWDQGKKTEAVEQYEKIIRSSSLTEEADRSMVFERVLSFEVERGNKVRAPPVYS